MEGPEGLGRSLTFSICPIVQRFLEKSRSQVEDDQSPSEYVRNIESTRIGLSIYTTCIYALYCAYNCSVPERQVASVSA